MVKERKILLYFINYLFVGLMICLFGISNVFATTYYMNYQYQQQYYDNSGNSVSAVTTTWNESLQSYISSNIVTVANSYGAGLSITSPVPLITNHTYTLSIYFEDTNNIALSSKNKIAVGNDLFGASYNYAHSDYWADTIQSNVNNNKILQFVFTVKGSASVIFIPWTTTTTTTQDYVLTEIVMDDLGSEGVSQTDINNSLNNQTNELNTSIQNSTNTITGAITETEDNINSNIDDMESAIVDSNKETQEVIKNQFNDCRDSVNLFDVNIAKQYSNYTSNNNIGTNWYSITIDLLPNTQYTITRFANNVSVDGGYNLQFYLYEDITNPLFYINNILAEKVLNKKTITFTTGESGKIYLAGLYINATRLSNLFNNINIQIQKGSVSTEYEVFGEEICTNKIDETNDNLDDLQSSITDESSPDIDGLANSAGWLPPGPLDSVLNLPLSLFNSLTTNLNKSCSPINLPLPYVNKNLTIPCINTLYEKIGISTFMTWLGVIVSGFMLYTYLLKLYKWIEDRISLNETHSVDNWGGL